MLRTHGNKITWLGHASFALTTPSGSVILIDPWLTGNPVCPPALKKPARVDAILITHGHGDHFGDVLPLARTHKPKIAAIYETAMWLQSEGIENVMPMSKGGTQKVGDVEVTMVNAFHSNGIESGQPGEPVIYGGEAAGFIVRMPEGLTIYHAGDTCVFGDMRIIGEHNGTARGGVCHSLARCAPRDSDALRNFPRAHRHTRSIARGHEGHRGTRNPRAQAGRIARLKRKRKSGRGRHDGERNPERCG
jgi:hypothetical protein